MRLRVTIEARREMMRVATRYDRKAPGLGDGFLDEVARTLGFIKTHPRARRTILLDTRRWPLRRFPYTVVYAVDRDVVYVLAIGHKRRGPRYWRGTARVPRR